MIEKKNIYKEDIKKDQHATLNACSSQMSFISEIVSNINLAHVQNKSNYYREVLFLTKILL